MVSSDWLLSKIYSADEGDVPRVEAVGWKRLVKGQQHELSEPIHSALRRKSGQSSVVTEPPPPKKKKKNLKRRRRGYTRQRFPDKTEIDQKNLSVLTSDATWFPWAHNVFRQRCALQQ